MIDLVTHPYALILDPLEELADTLGRIEDWLLFSDPEPGLAVVTVRAGAYPTAALSCSITEPSAQAPTLYAPNKQIELAPLAVVQRDLTSALATVRRAKTLPSEHPLAQTLSRLDPLDRCVVSSRYPGGSASVRPPSTVSGSATIARSVRCWPR